MNINALLQAKLGWNLISLKHKKNNKHNIKNLKKFKQNIL